MGINKLRNAVRGVIADHDIRPRFHRVVSIAHRDTGACRFQHTDIIVVIAKRHHILHRPALRFNPLGKALPFAVPFTRDIHLIVPGPFALQTQLMLNLLHELLQFWQIFIGQREFPDGVDVACRLRQRRHLSKGRALFRRQRLRPVSGTDHMAGRAFINHRVINVHQTVNLMRIQQINQLQCLIDRQSC